MTVTPDSLSNNPYSMTMLKFSLFCVLAVLVFPALATEVEPSNQPTTIEGEEITAPQVKILGRDVITTEERREREREAAIPTAMADPEIKKLMNRQRDITYYQHSPTRGNPNAPLKFVLFNDLSCVQCIPIVQQIEDVRRENVNDVYFVHVHLPVDQFNATNPAVFYGKLAQRLGLFWDYRERVMAAETTQSEAFMRILLDLGVDRDTLRRLIRTEARQLYQEMDADTALTKQMNLGRPPILFVNGIKVGEGKLLENLSSMAEYLILIQKWQEDI